MRFEGLSGLTVDDAKKEMCLVDRRCTSERPIVEDVLVRDELVLQGNLYDHGYAAAKLEKTLVQDTLQGTLFTFRVLEGPRFRVSSIEVAETTPLPHRAPKLTIPPVETKKGAWFSRRTLAEDRSRIERVFRDAGYGKADVLPQVDLDLEQAEIAVRVVISRGVPITIARIRTPNGPSSLVLEKCTKLGLLPGSLFNESKLLELKRALEGSHPDVAVAILDVEGHPDQVEVSVELP
ncbi:MAG: hypothetical protein HOV80_14710 [Polyangiaceae bacterium]|nr:hypothetical protein [Polyangiaceae bacterium]